jgi:mRNA-degrading endonuclease RelE of RelBE toxin-antitoxin system
VSSGQLELISYAADDFRYITKKNSSLKKLILVKLLAIESEPALMGQPLTGSLADMRKIKVGDRIWRIVWKVLKKNSQVWGIGKRDHSEIYKEVERRINILGSNPETLPLANLLLQLQAKVLPDLIRSDISEEILLALHVEMGLSAQTITTLSPNEAESLYERYLKNK